MSYKLELRPLATLEIFEAYDWYELQREGLGLEFLDEVEEFYKSCYSILIYILTIIRLSEKAKYPGSLILLFMR